MAEQEKEECRWKSKYDLTYKCGEPVVVDGHCTLHDACDGKGLEAFKKEVEKRLRTGDEKIDLKGCYFPRDFDKGYFRGYQFNKPVDFSEATFTKGAYFLRATFSAVANFGEATFSEGANFSWAKFSEGADFAKAEFSVVASFVGATFTERANFSIATFSEGYFVDTSFEKGVLFDWAEFRERVRFEAVERDEKRVFFGPDSSFQDTRFLGEEVVFQGVKLSNCSFLHSNIDKIDFRYCKFAKEEKKSYSIFPTREQNVLRDELDADKKVEESLNKSDMRFFALLRMTGSAVREKKYEPVRRLYQELKCNFENKKDWNTAGDFHYGEMECRRKGRLGGWLDFLLVTTYYRASGYGERPLRALLWWFFSTLLFFPLLYRLSEHDPLSACVWDSVRVATFMKIGIPIEPESWGRIVLTLQYFICPTLLALFALALRRKVKR